MAANDVKTPKTADNGAKKGPIAWCGRLFKKIGKAFYNMYHELKKVTWPTKSALINYSIVVLLFLVVMGVIIGVFDLGASAVIKLITG
ncbi:MAG: preprotein translocase subunit SecE [Clostridia bacterium]|nr:preprotein translocase subunit SecE [Clostridia bacterium]